jgi:sortase A
VRETPDAEWDLDLYQFVTEVRQTMWKFSKSMPDAPATPFSNARRQGGRRAVSIWMQRILLVSGLTLVTFYCTACLESWLGSRVALKRFAAAEKAGHLVAESRSEKLVSTNSSSEGKHPGADFSLWSRLRLKAYTRGAQKRSAIPLAVLRIPAIRLEAPIFDGADGLTLNHGVGRIPGTAHPGEAGNIGIAGHRDGFFRGLKDVKIGDAIELKTPTETTTYLVDRIQIVSPRQVDVLRSTSVGSLTLVTCYPFYYLGSAPSRYVVTASLETEKIGEPENSKLGTPATASKSTRRFR